jgi:type II secretory ATPase GspE/PulE/Tfp pilus assembly ATPase PilB-like protein
MKSLTNCNVLVIGSPGSGKSVLAKALLARVPRSVVFDPMAEYFPVKETTAQLITNSADEAIGFLADCYDEDFSLVYRTDGYATVEEYDLICQMIERMQQEPAAGPLALAMEEASTFSTTTTIGDQIRRIHNMGRKWGISVLSIIQVDTDAHRILRANAHVVVAMRQMKLSTDMRRLFRQQDVTKLEGMDQGGYVPVPIEGRHYLLAPLGADLFGQWSRAVGS